MTDTERGDAGRWQRACRGVRLALVVFGLMCMVGGPTAASEGITDDVIDRASRQVLESPDFRSLRRRLQESPKSDSASDKGFVASALRWLQEQLSAVGQRIGDFFQWMFGDLFKRDPRGKPDAADAESWWNSVVELTAEFFRLMASLGSRTLVLSVLLVVLVFVILVVARVIRQRDRQQVFAMVHGGELAEDVSEITVAPGELPPAVYETRALRLAAAGDYRAAIRELLLGSMSWLERSSLIRFRRGLTNRDYYRSIWRRPEKRQAWIATASQFELVYFGRRQPTQEMFETCLIEFQGAFREEESPTV
jgi:hypothetical protein